MLQHSDHLSGIYLWKPLDLSYCFVHFMCIFDAVFVNFCPILPHFRVNRMKRMKDDESKIKTMKEDDRGGKKKKRGCK